MESLRMLLSTELKEAEKNKWVDIASKQKEKLTNFGGYTDKRIAQSKDRMYELLSMNKLSINQQAELYSYVNKIWDKKFMRVGVNESICSVSSSISSSIKIKCIDLVNFLYGDL